MKKYLIIGLALVLYIPTLLLGKEETNRLIGYWLTSDKSMKIEIYENADSTFAGKIIWLKEPNDKNDKPRKDSNNPDKKLQERPLLELVILTGLVPESSTKYKSGKLYDPHSGKTYSATIELVNNNTINIRYFIATPALGRTDTWTRTAK